MGTFILGAAIKLELTNYMHLITTGVNHLRTDFFSFYLNASRRDYFGEFFIYIYFFTFL